MVTKPLRADARRNREKIVAAAVAAFTEYGSDAQMDDIAGRAGVGVGTLYRNFPTKDALVGAIVLAQMEENAALAAEMLEEALAPWECFSGFIRRAGLKDHALAEVISTQPTETFLGALEASGLGEHVTTMIERAQAEGTLNPDVSMRDIPIFMCGMGAVVRSFDGEQRDRYLDVVLRGMRA
jgi:AcrR family transcriptional regulator